MHDKMIVHETTTQHTIHTTATCLVSSQIKSFESNLADNEFILICSVMGCTMSNNQSILYNTNMFLLGCKVGLCIATLPSFNMCNSVVFPALSKPKNKILALL